MVKMYLISKKLLMAVTLLTILLTSCSSDSSVSTSEDDMDSSLDLDAAAIYDEDQITAQDEDSTKDENSVDSDQTVTLDQDSNYGDRDSGIMPDSDSEKSCSSENLALCTDSEECTNAGGYWYLDTCNDKPQPMIDYSVSGLLAAEDTIVGYWTSAPHGDDETLWMGYASEYLFNDNGYAGLIQFSLPHQVDERINEVSSAVLTLRTQSNIEGMAIRISRLTEGFQEEEVNWESRPDSDPSRYVLWSCEPGAPCTSWGGEISIDLSSLFTTVGHSQTLGLVIERTDTGGPLHLATSKEHSKLPGPKLDMAYKAVQEPAPPVIPEPPMGQTEELFGLDKVTDATIINDNPDQNYGSYPNIALAPGSYGAEVAGTSCALIQFDLATSVIDNPTRAELVLTPIYEMAKGKTLRIYRLTESFDEASVTWNSRPTYDESNYIEWASPGVIKNARMSINIPITSLLLDNNLPDTLGLVIQSEDYTDTFTSVNGGWPTYGERPMLRLSTRPVLKAEPSPHPNHGMYEKGEDAAVRFSVSGLTSPSILTIQVVDQDEKILKKASLSVTPDSNHEWSALWDAPDNELGFYRVKAHLATGTPIEQEGSRNSGYLNYAIVPNPAERPLLAPREAFFGIFSVSNWFAGSGSMLGTRWFSGTSTFWNTLEKDGPGTYATARAAAPGNIHPKAMRPGLTIGRSNEPWVNYNWVATYRTSPSMTWAIDPDSGTFVTHALTTAGESHWHNFVEQVALNQQLISTSPDFNVYKTTWEPANHNYFGTPEQLVDIHRIAYGAIHAVDPNAVVVGASKNAIGILQETIDLLDAGLGQYVDGIAIHAYQSHVEETPPETLGRLSLRQYLFDLKQALKDRGLEHLKIYDLESGFGSGKSFLGEMKSAEANIRSQLILLGEGVQMSTFFTFRNLPEPNGRNWAMFQNHTVENDSKDDNSAMWGTGNSFRNLSQYEWRVSPKPLVPAYAAMTFLVDGHRPAQVIEAVGGNVESYSGEDLFGYSYFRGDGQNRKVVLAIWDYGYEPGEVVIETGESSVEVYDWMGNMSVVTTEGGKLTLSLSNRPVYIKGASFLLWGPEK